MAKAQYSIQVKTNAEVIGKAVAAMAAHFEAAPEDDPAKRAMMDFGEIEPNRDLRVVSRFEDGVIRVTVSMRPELQTIADMVAG